MDPELQAQLAHIVALLNSLDRKLDVNHASTLALFNELLIKIDDQTRKLDDIADQMGIVIENTDD